MEVTHVYRFNFKVLKLKCYAYGMVTCWTVHVCCRPLPCPLPDSFPYRRRPDLGRHAFLGRRLDLGRHAFPGRGRRDAGRREYDRRDPGLREAGTDAHGNHGGLGPCIKIESLIGTILRLIAILNPPSVVHCH